LRAAGGVWCSGRSSLRANPPCGRSFLRTPSPSPPLTRGAFLYPLLEFFLPFLFGGEIGLPNISRFELSILPPVHRIFFAFSFWRRHGSAEYVSALCNPFLPSAIRIFFASLFGMRREVFQNISRLELSILSPAHRIFFVFFLKEKRVHSYLPSESSLWAKAPCRLKPARPPLTRGAFLYPLLEFSLPFFLEGT